MKTSYECTEITEMILMLLESTGANPEICDRAKRYKFEVGELFRILQGAILEQGVRNLTLQKALKALEMDFHNKEQRSLFPDWIEKAPQNLRQRYRDEFLTKKARQKGF